MCGIVAYLGPNSAHSVLIEGLKRLEYRGYDSAGVATLAGGKMTVHRSVGRVSVLEDLLARQDGGEARPLGAARAQLH